MYYSSKYIKLYCYIENRSLHFSSLDIVTDHQLDHVPDGPEKKMDIRDQELHFRRSN